MTHGTHGSLMIVMLMCGLITFLIRLSFIAGARWLPYGLRVQTALRFVPPAVLAALIFPEIFLRAGTAAMMDLSRPGAALVAVLVAYVTRSIAATIAAGMAAMWLIRWLA